MTDPAASIVIPSSGRPFILELVLDSLCRQGVPAAEFEVIVVDDGASPPLAARLQPYADRLPCRSIRLERQGPAAARNAAAQIAKSPLLIFLDDDCVPDPGWLKAYLKAYSGDPDSVLAGPIVNGLPGDQCSEAYHLIFGYLYSRHVERTGVVTDSPFVISANFGISTDLFLSTGGFDERFRIAAEDRMFSEVWVRSGRLFRAVPDAVVRHHRPLTLGNYLSQQYRYGRGGMIFREELRARGWSGPTFERGSFYYRLLLSAFRHPDPRRRVPLFLLLAISQAAVAAGYAVEYFRRATMDRPS